MGDYTLPTREDRLFYDGLNMMMSVVYFLFVALIIDVMLLGATGEFTMLAIIISVPFIGLGYHRVRRFFTDRPCPACGHPVRLDLFCCPNCRERFLGIP